MEVQDGFIVGIFNYCDRWCERCPLTNRCRLFADMAEIDFEQGNGPLTEPRMRRERRRLAAQMIELHAEAEERGEQAGRTPDECLGHLPQGLESSFGPDPEVVANGSALRSKVRKLELSANPSVGLAIQTIQYFSFFVPFKMLRALLQVWLHGPG